jgi:hypothetical protein
MVKMGGWCFLMRCFREGCGGVKKNTKCNAAECSHKYVTRCFPIQAFSGAVVQAIHDHGELFVGDGIE